ncbi:metal-dependent hydrolase [Mariniblastus sp.]|nr:metal-dependent hydrolase [Mariniblastus sp.]
MADFKTHITASSILGVGYATVGFTMFDVPPAHALVAAALCSVAGMLPDLDSNSGIPQREMLSFVSVVVPMLMIERFEQLQLNHEQMVFAAGVMYVMIRFGLGNLFKKYTKHRGMWHSIPAALVAGMATFLVCLTPDVQIRIFKAWAVVIGFISHLVLDEVYAVNWQGKLPRAKKSFGTALKFLGKDRFPNFLAYANLIWLTFLILNDDYLMECMCGHDPAVDPHSAAGFIDSWFKHSPTVHR